MHLMNLFKHVTSSLEFVDLVEAISYVVCGEDNLKQENFHKVQSFIIMYNT